MRTFGCSTPPCQGFNIGSTGILNGKGVALQNDGKIVVAGATTDGAGGMFVVQRFSADGLIDPTFGCDTPPCASFVTGPTETGFAVALQPDGKIVVSGSNADQFGDTYGRIARYENDAVPTETPTVTPSQSPTDTETPTSTPSPTEAAPPTATQTVTATRAPSNTRTPTAMAEDSDDGCSVGPARGSSAFAAWLLLLPIALSSLLKKAHPSKVGRPPGIEPSRNGQTA